MLNRIWYLLSVKLSGEATQADLDEFHDLLREHPELETSIQQITRYWLQSNPTTSHHHTEAEETIWRRHLERLKASGAAWAEPSPGNTLRSVEKRPLGALHRFRWAAAAVVLFCLAGWWLTTFRNTDKSSFVAKTNQNQVVTRPASRTQLRLPDGSKVWVNASSKLTYGNGFGEENRNVWLEGEAYFEVFKNKSLPFIIHTSRMNIRVTGTVFNVRAYPQEASSETALIEGSVEVALPGDKDWKYHLKPLQKLVVDDNGVTYGNPAVSGRKFAAGATVSSFTASLQSLSKPLSDNQVVETAWVYNMLSFSDESFRQVANKMEKWYGAAIQFHDPDMENWHFTGSFRSETLTEALTALQLTTPFSFTVRGNEVIIAKPDNNK